MINKTTSFLTTAIAPTAEQLEIQHCADRSLLIEAAAGSAKTTTLALRICQALALGADPRGMLALTFTDTACTALRKALAFISGGREPGLRQLRIETFDGYAAGVLRRIETLDGEDPVEHFRTAEQAAPFVWAAIDAVGANAREGFHDELQLPSHGSDSYVGEFLRRGAGIKGRLLLELNPPEGRRRHAGLRDRGTGPGLHAAARAAALRGAPHRERARPRQLPHAAGRHLRPRAPAAARRGRGGPARSRYAAAGAASAASSSTSCTTATRRCSRS